MSRERAAWTLTGWFRIDFMTFSSSSSNLDAYSLNEL